MAEREPFASYEGQGRLCWVGGQEDACGFRAEHDAVQGIFLNCTFDEMDFFKAPGDKASGFAGRTTDGEYEVVAEGEIILANARFGAGQSGGFTHLTLLPRTLTVSRVGQYAAAQLRFGLTNFRFFGTVEGQHILPLRLQSGGAETNVRIVGVDGYYGIVEIVKARREARVTCEAVIGCDDAMNVERATEVIDNLCYVLSVARGTKIQWLYCHELDPEGNPIRKHHHNRTVMPYTSSSLIDDRPEGRDETKRFIEMVYPVYVQKREAYLFNRGLIDAYLEAKAEGDHIERRAIKLAVSLEMMKDLFLRSPGCPVDEFVIEEKRFNRLSKPLRNAIKEVLQSAGIDDTAIHSVCGKLTELNRTIFKQILIGLFEAIGFSPDAEEIDLFVRCRNGLVHAGRFYQPKEQERKYLYRDPPSPGEHDPRKDYIAVYLFIVNFLDRVFLKLLGYSGQYVNHKWLSPSRDATAFPDHLP